MILLLYVKILLNAKCEEMTIWRKVEHNIMFRAICEGDRIIACVSQHRGNLISTCCGTTRQPRSGSKKCFPTTGNWGTQQPRYKKYMKIVKYIFVSRLSCTPVTPVILSDQGTLQPRYKNIFNNFHIFLYRGCRVPRSMRITGLTGVHDSRDIPQL